MEKINSKKTIKDKYADRLPKNLQTGDGKKKIPFEKLDYSLNSPKAKCVSFKTSQERMLGWVWALQWLYENESEFCDKYKVEITVFRDNGKTEAKDDEIVQLMVVRLNHRDPVVDLNVNVRFYLTSGTIMIQGNGYKEWGSSHMTPLVELVDQYKQFEKEIADTPNDTQNSSGEDNTSNQAKHGPPAPSIGDNANKDSSCDTDAMNNQIKSPNTQNTVTPVVVDDTEQRTPVGNENKSPKSKDLSTLKKTLLNRAKRINSDREKDFIDLCSTLDNDIIDTNTRLDNMQDENLNSTVRIENQVKLVSSTLTTVDVRIDQVVTTLGEILENQTKIMHELQIIKKKGNSRSSVEFPKEHIESLDNVNSNLKSLQSQILNIGKHTPSPVTNMLSELDKEDQTGENPSSDDNQISDTGEKPTLKPYNSKNTLYQSSPVSDNNTLSLSPGKSDIILGDSRLHEVRSDMLLSESSCVRTFGGAAIHDIITLVHKVPEDYTSAKNVFIQVGFKDTKSPVSDDIVADKLNCLVDTLQSTFPRARIGLSSVIPCKTNKNRVVINNINSIMQKVCSNRNVVYINLVPRFEQIQGRPNKDLYRDEVHPNNKGVEEIIAGINDFILKGYDTIDLTKDNRHSAAVAAESVTGSPHIAVGQSSWASATAVPPRQTTSHNAAATVKTSSPSVPVSQRQHPGTTTARMPQPSASMRPAPTVAPPSAQGNNSTTNMGVVNGKHFDINSSNPKIIDGNVFTAFSARVNDVTEVRQVIRSLYSINENVENATSNTVVYRCRSGPKLVQRWDDDGERGAGKAVMEVLQSQNIENVVVIISRHFAKHIGPLRFDVMKDIAFETLKPYLSTTQPISTVSASSRNTGSAHTYDRRKNNNKHTRFNRWKRHDMDSNSRNVNQSKLYSNQSNTYQAQHDRVETSRASIPNDHHMSTNMHDNGNTVVKPNILTNGDPTYAKSDSVTVNGQGWNSGYNVYENNVQMAPSLFHPQLFNIPPPGYGQAVIGNGQMPQQSQYMRTIG